MEINELFLNQVNFFKSGKTKPYSYRIKALKSLKNAITKHEEEIFEALYKDLHKSKYEAYLSEVGFVLEELNFHIKKLKKWMKPKKVKSGLTLFPASTYNYYEPLGNVLIIAPWNYPFQLLIAPLIGAISAGNTAILKPSEYSENTAFVLEKSIKNTFDSNYIAVVTGDAKVSQELLKHKYNHIFFTGSPSVGKIVYKTAAANMIPVTLELGGKSPCIIDKNTKLKLTAKRIMWGKLLNAGQTCIAPDYLLVHKDIKNKLLPLLVKETEKFFGKNPIENEEFPRIISKPNINRLASFIDDAEIYYGGNYNIDKKYFQPTILNNVTFDDNVMQQEIFGPILPVIEYNNIQDIINKINNLPKPLALYLFTEDKRLQQNVLENISAGGVTINDTLMHIANNNIAFGGVGNSGIGGYHGFYSFERFSNNKPFLKRATYLDIPLRYAPFKGKLKLLKQIMK
jgi:aldehyde dehydrogenase (NAD+)